MDTTYKKEFGVSDPAHYDTLIADQKRRVRQRPHNVKGWLELGRLHESKLDMTNDLARRHIVIRYCFPLMLMWIMLSMDLVSKLALAPWQSNGLFPLLAAIITALTLFYVYSLRYPASGKKCFRKAVSIDSKGNYPVPLLDALSGLIFEVFSVVSATIFVARLHFPFFHFKIGSGQAVQYHPEEYSLLRRQPEHCSIISWQIPPL